MLKLYNTLTKEKTLFKPMQGNTVGMYVCGVTVYDYSHVGHARVYIVFDMVNRYLRHLNYNVIYTRNITDIDDKIIKRANEIQQPISAITEKFIAAFHEDMQALNNFPPTHEPRATDYIPEMIAMIEQLIAKGYAYVGSNGDVFYDVSQFAHYGKLSHQDLENLRAGERVALDDAKQDPLDFVLWKLAKAGEPSWGSPWGAGRPGWHIECSAMSLDCLHQHFDIHGGGLDLTFPHHENEIAQTEGATGQPFMNNWMHVGFVQINKEKMSKSLNNFFTIREVCEKFDAEVLRYFILASHYRSPINYSEENLQHAKASLERFYTALRGLPTTASILKNSSYEQRFMVAMNDDFNTPEAFAVLFELATEINKLRSHDLKAASELGSLLRYLADLLGLLKRDANEFLQGDNQDVSHIEALVQQRSAARAAKDWSASDRIRAELDALNIVVEDSASGATWRRK